MSSQQRKPLTHDTQDAVNGLRLVKDALHILAGENPSGGQANTTATRAIGHAISRLSYLDVQITKASRTCETCMFMVRPVDCSPQCDNPDSPSVGRVVDPSLDGCRRWKNALPDAVKRNKAKR